MEQQIRLAGLIIVFLGTILSLRKGRDAPVMAFIIFSPFTYFSYYVGIVLSPAKLIGVIFLLYWILWGDYRSVLKNRYFSYFIIYYIYIVVITFVMMPFLPEMEENIQGFLYSSSMRGFIQFIQILMGLSIVLMILSRLGDASRLLRSLTAMLVSMIILAIWGLYVWIAQQTGLPFNTITRQGGLTGHEVGRKIGTYINDIYVVRAYSLSGEPKSLAVNAIMGVMLTYLTPALSYRVFRRPMVRYLLIGFFVFILFITLSTAGYIIMPAALAISMAVLAMARRLPATKIIHSAFFLVLGLGVLQVSGHDVMGKISQILDIRVQERLDSQGMFTYAEAAALEHWKNSPHLVITGVGVGGATFYVRLYDTESYAGFVAAPRGIIGFITDRGLIGLFLFLFAFYKSMKMLIVAVRVRAPNWPIYSGILVICAVNLVLLFTYALWYVEWLTVGLLCTSAALARRECILIRNPASACLTGGNALSVR